MLEAIVRSMVEEKVLGERNDGNGLKLNSHFVNEICVFRTYSAGVHVGKLLSREGKECLVADSRRIWSWKGACTLSQLAMEGSKSIDECRIAMVVPKILLTEVIEVIPMSDVAIKNIMGAPEWKK